MVGRRTVNKTNIFFLEGGGANIEIYILVLRNKGEKGESGYILDEENECNELKLRNLYIKIQ